MNDVVLAKEIPRTSFNGSIKQNLDDICYLVKPRITKYKSMINPNEYFKFLSSTKIHVFTMEEELVPRLEEMIGRSSLGIICTPYIEEVLGRNILIAVCEDDEDMLFNMEARIASRFHPHYDMCCIIFCKTY